MDINAHDANHFDIVTMRNAAPGGSTNIWFGCPVNARIEIIAIAATFTTSAVAGNRLIHGWITDGTNDFQLFQGVNLQPASLSLTHHFDHTGDRGVNSTVYENLLAALPRNMFLREGDSLVIDSVNPQAGDTFDNIVIRFKQWITPTA
jgi:hypothetical protein